MAHQWLIDHHAIQGQRGWWAQRGLGDQRWTDQWVKVTGHQGQWSKRAVVPTAWPQIGAAHCVDSVWGGLWSRRRSTRRGLMVDQSVPHSGADTAENCHKTNLSTRRLHGDMRSRVFNVQGRNGKSSPADLVAGSIGKIERGEIESQDECESQS